MSENKMTEIIRASIDSIKSSFDANTVTGTPITTANGTVIIPVSKLSVGFATGGVDYLGKNAPQSGKNNFGGGGGTGVTVTPIAFIVVSADSKVEMLNISAPVVVEPRDAVSQIIGAIERSPELITKFKEVFGKKADTTTAE